MSATLVQQAEEPSREAMGTAWLSQQALLIPAAILLWLAAPAIATLVPDRSADATAFLRLLPLTLPLAGLRTLPTAMLERHLEFGPQAFAEVTGQVAFYSVAIAMALAGAGAASLVAGALAHAVAPTLVILRAWGRLPPLAFDASLLPAMVRFGLPYQGAAIASWLRDAVVPFCGAVVAGPTVAGYLQFSWRIGQLVGVFEEIVARVSFPTFSRLRADPEGLERAIRAANRLGLVVTAPLAAWTAVAAPSLVPAVFGPAWQPAVPVIQLVCVGAIARYLMSILRQALFASGRPAAGFAVAAAALGLTVVPVVVLLATIGLIGAGIGFVIGSVAALIAARRIGAGTPTPPLRDLLRIASWATISGLAGAAVLALVDGPVGLVGSALAGLVVTAVAILLLEAEVVRSIAGLRPHADGDTPATSA